jgi:ATP-dependent Clp protease ATP-binding subunit ClpC
MASARSQAEIVTLRKLAQQIADGRKERMTTVHLLAAIASGETPAAELLRDRKLDVDVLLKASRSFDDEGADPISRVFAAARSLSVRVDPRTGARPQTEPASVHLLLALLADRGLAAHRSLVHAGFDLARLRSAAMQLALGVVSARRPVSTQAAMKAVTRSDSSPPPSHSRPSTSLRAPEGPGVAVPLYPPPSAHRPTARATTTAKKPIEATPVTPTVTTIPATPKTPPAEPVALPTPRANKVVETVQPRAAKADVSELAKACPTLFSVGVDLTRLAKTGGIDAPIGRDAEIDRLLDILGKRTANSACLIGPAGVGKTSIARGLAVRIAEDPRDDRALVELSPSELLAGTGTRGALAEKWSKIRAEIAAIPGKVILFIDELHELVGPGAFDEAATEIKVGLTRGELTIVGATSPEEFRRSVESDPALARRFTGVDIDEPEESDAFLVLRRVSDGLTEHHGLSYQDEAIASAVSWSVRYLPGRALPDKAISVLDLAGARARRAGKRGEIEPSDVAAIVCELADVPIERLLQTDGERMLDLEKLLGERVIGHGASLSRIARVLRKSAAGLRGKRPIGSFLLLGPTGVGKTETAKAIAEALFHSPDAMTRLDLSEYSEAHSIARLVGAPPGYIGHEAGGQLTEAVKRRPYQVVLLDEIEKAHRDVLEGFLQVFDEGRLTDGRGRRVDFTNTVIVMTSNLGASELSALRSHRSVGFSRGPSGPSNDKLAETMIAAARSHLPPELYNRIDEVLCFGPLARTDVARIAELQLEALADSLEDRGMKLDIDASVIERLLDEGGFDPELGARPLRRTIGRLIETPLAELILRGELASGGVALVTVEDGAIVVDALAPKRAAG